MIPKTNQQSLLLYLSYQQSLFEIGTTVQELSNRQTHYHQEHGCISSFGQSFLLFCSQYHSARMIQIGVTCTSNRHPNLGNSFSLPNLPNHPSVPIHPITPQLQLCFLITEHRVKAMRIAVME